MKSRVILAMTCLESGPIQLWCSNFNFQVPFHADPPAEKRLGMEQKRVKLPVLARGN